MPPARRTPPSPGPVLTRCSSSHHALRLPLWAILAQPCSPLHLLCAQPSGPTQQPCLQHRPGSSLDPGLRCPWPPPSLLEYLVVTGHQPISEHSPSHTHTHTPATCCSTPRFTVTPTPSCSGPVHWTHVIPPSASHSSQPHRKSCWPISTARPDLVCLLPGSLQEPGWGAAVTQAMFLGRSVTTLQILCKMSNYILSLTL